MAHMNTVTADRDLVKILIVDDEGDVCFLLRNMLDKEKFICDQANTLSQAMVHVKEDPPAIIFLDNHLPDGLGINIVEALKAEKEDLKVAVITAHDGLFDKRRAMKNGADLFITKPFNKADIFDAIERFLARPDGFPLRLED